VSTAALTRAYERWPIERAFEGIAASGIRDVGLWEGPREAPLFTRRSGQAAVSMVLALADRLGLTLSLLTHRVEIGRASRLEDAIGTAADLGIGSLAVVPVTTGFRVSERLRQETWLVGTLDQAVSTGLRKGVRILIKPHGGIAASGPDLARIIELVGSPRLGVWYDPGNVCHYMGLRPEDDVHAVARYVNAVCAKDFRGSKGSGHFPTPGDGEIDFVSIFRTLAACGRLGPCYLEKVTASDSPEDVDRELRRGRSHLEKAAALASAS
jgi:sugar phosphate isomerase/epimerase